MTGASGASLAARARVSVASIAAGTPLIALASSMYYISSVEFYIVLVQATTLAIFADVDICFDTP
eukprot:scaffold77100_cov30-Attheya_sp.AAC.1